MIQIQESKILGQRKEKAFNSKTKNQFDLINWKPVFNMELKDQSLRKGTAGNTSTHIQRERINDKTNGVKDKMNSWGSG